LLQFAEIFASLGSGPQAAIMNLNMSSVLSSKPHADWMGVPPPT